MMRRAKADLRLHPLRWPLRLTRAGMVAERGLRAFWPLASVVMTVLAALMLGLQDLVSAPIVWGALILGLAALVLTLGWGLWRFSWPSRAETLARLDASLPGRPVTALLDDQAIGATDAGSAALWQAHQARMAQAAAKAQAPAPNLRIAKADPFALRYLALLSLLVALVFGSVWRIGSLSVMPGDTTAELTGPSWEGWIEPPRYTGLPVLYLNDQQAPELELPQGSRITLRLYGEVGALELIESLSDPETTVQDPVLLEREFEVVKSGELAINGPGGRRWAVTMLADQPPSIAITGLPELTRDGALSLGFAAEDDYGIAGGEVRITLDTLALSRRHGLKPEPEPREDIVLDLPLPLSGSRQSFTEFLIEDFAQHPWANLPVIYSFTVRDAAGQSSTTSGLGAPLIAPRFFDPLAAAVAEQRRDLLWTRQNAPRIAQVMRTLSHRPQEIFREAGSYLQMRAILRRLEAAMTAEEGVGAAVSLAQQEESAAALWALARSLEEGDIGDALARMQQAKERLSQAMRDGASDEEIARLMQELREATQDYMRQLQRQAQRDGQQGESGEGQENAMTLSQQDLQAMMDRIQELMEQGRMAEAEQALEEFQRMMENMRITQSQPGEGGSDGRQAMEELGETLREQQGLSDQAFRDLQEQFNPNAQSGESQNNEGRSGGQGRGQQHQGGSGGDGQSGQEGGEGQSGQGGQAQGGPQGGDQRGGEGSGGSLAEQQQALREALRRQQGGLPLGQGEEGQTTREALDRAGEAMEGAEEALREGDLAEAIDRQSEAMEALREGMRALGEAMAQSQQPGEQQGQGQQANRSQADPLGRDRNAGGLGDERNAPLGEGRAYRRAWDLLEELRRRAGEQERGQDELLYFERLLEPF